MDLRKQSRLGGKIRSEKKKKKKKKYVRTIANHTYYIKIVHNFYCTILKFLIVLHKFLKYREEPRPIRRVRQKLIEENKKKKNNEKNTYLSAMSHKESKILRKIKTDVTNF